MKKATAEGALADVIGTIYDAAVDPGLWTEALAQVTEFCGGQSGCIGSMNTVNQHAEWFSYWNVDPAYVALYLDHYKRYDPFAGLLLHERGRAVPVDRLMAWADLVGSKFYLEWTVPQQICDASSVILEKSALEFTAAVVMTDQQNGRVTEDTNRRLSYLAPHLSRAFKLGSLIELKQQERSSFAETVDALANGVLILDASGRILHANPRGQQALSSSGCLTSSRGRLIARDPRLDRPLQAALAAAAGGDMGHNVNGFALPMTAQSGERHVLHTLPLTRANRARSGMPAPAVVAVFICPVSQYKSTMPDVLRAALGLTPTELRVLLALVEVGGVPQIAEELGLAVSTVKTHLGRIYTKAGVNRQADLVKLVMGLASPLAGN